MPHSQLTFLSSFQTREIPPTYIKMHTLLSLIYTLITTFLLLNLSDATKCQSNDFARGRFVHKTIAIPNLTTDTATTFTSPVAITEPVWHCTSGCPNQGYGIIASPYDDVTLGPGIISPPAGYEVSFPRDTMFSIAFANMHLGLDRWTRWTTVSWSLHYQRPKIIINPFPWDMAISSPKAILYWSIYPHGDTSYQWKWESSLQFR